MHMPSFILPFPHWWTCRLSPVFHITEIILKQFVLVFWENTCRVLKVIWKERSYLKSVTTLIWSFPDLKLVTALIKPHCILFRLWQFSVCAPNWDVLAFQMEVCNIDKACCSPRRLPALTGDHFPFFAYAQSLFIWIILSVNYCLE